MSRKNNNDQHDEAFQKAWQNMFHAEQENDKSQDFLSGALELRKIYDTYVQAGFSNAEAMQIICALLEGGMKR